MAENNNTQSGGLGFFGLLAIVFITLKLTHIIDWSWWWVTAPLWGPVAALLGISIIIAIFMAIQTFFEK
jgi:hypothetical protein